MLKSTKPTVTDSAVKYVDASKISVGDFVTVLITVPSGAANSVYIGGPNVTTGNGYPIAAGATWGFDKVGPGDDVYLVAPANTDVNVLVAGL